MVIRCLRSKVTLKGCSAPQFTLVLQLSRTSLLQGSAAIRQAAFCFGNVERCRVTLSASKTNFLVVISKNLRLLTNESSLTVREFVVAAVRLAALFPSWRTRKTTSQAKVEKEGPSLQPRPRDCNLEAPLSR